ncbi:class I SAM-dependent methyltransferase [Candidatus Pseudothioglobus sp. Uisw_050_01]|uniref:class I SAM-dependent methyltransferase n=1 Tax=Candidatus Pseudothioglobus sp. Uisw_050_01 TaxID=3230997 RepID=UPI003A84E368
MSEDIKLHLGCWHRYIPGFIHIDLCDMSHIDYKSGIDDLSMFTDESVSLIYSSHNFEYFNPAEALEVLKEWSRVLKPNGLLRIALPDFDSLIEVYHKSGKIESILGPLYGQMDIQTQTEKITLFHKTVYNFNSMSKLLGDNGFKDVKKYNWQETLHKDYDDHSQSYFPHMDKENGILVSLNVEATKI